MRVSEQKKTWIGQQTQSVNTAAPTLAAQSASQKQEDLWRTAYWRCFCTIPLVRSEELIQQSKTVEPNSTYQHRFISTGQTRPPLFQGQMYISNANFYPSAIPTSQPLDVPFFIVSPAGQICGRDRCNIEWAGGRERRREGRCCCWHTAALPKAEEHREAD